MRNTAVESDELASLGLQRRLDVDGLRGFAVVAVVAYHFFPDFVKSGFVGVDVFLVISGFVITNLLMRRNVRSGAELARFWGHRLRRLAPAFVLVVGVSLGIGWFTFWPQVYSGMGANALWASASAGNFYSWTQSNYFSLGAVASPLLNLWSLGVEEQFYLVWPLTVALVLTWRRWMILAAITVAAVVSWAASLWFVAKGGGGIDAVSAVFYLPWFRAWELLLGCGVAVLSLLPVQSWFWRFIQRIAVWAYPVALLMLIASFFPAPWRIVPGAYALVPVLLTGLLIVLGRTAPVSSHLSASAGPLWFGRISYPLYLWHWPLLAAAVSLGLMDALWGAPLTIVLSVLLAWLTWRWVERPIQRRSVTARQVVALVILTAIVGSVGAVIAWQKGFPQRLSGVAASLAGYEFDPRPGVRSGRCFMESTGAADAEALTQCLVPEQGRRNVLLWGDSHAAHLYPGLATELPDGSTLSQLTMASCLPSEPPDAATSEGCGRMNAIAREAIAAGEFSDVVMSGRWQSGDGETLSRTLDDLVVPEGTHVTIVGPDPEWVPSLPLAWSMFEAARLLDLPEYSNKGLSPEPMKVRKEILPVVEASGYDFFDPWETLCRGGQCLVRTGPGVDSLTSYDSGHLTDAGSGFVAGALVEKLGLGRSQSPGP